MRFLNLLVLAMLLMAAAYVYEIKFESTLRAERIAKAPAIDRVAGQERELGLRAALRILGQRRYRLVRARLTLRAMPSMVTARYPPARNVFRTAETTSMSMRSSRGLPRERSGSVRLGIMRARRARDLAPALI